MTDPITTRSAESRSSVSGRAAASTSPSRRSTRSRDHAHRFIRTTRHPSAVARRRVATSFDDVYEAADTFADVYAEITERLVAAATEHGEILYAVPGSPLVLERTRAASAQRPRGSSASCCRRCRSSTSPSPALGIDPVEAGVRLIDGHEFATAAAGDHGPMLVAHTHANWVLSDIKLAVEGADRRRTGGDPAAARHARRSRSSTRRGPSSTAPSRPIT